MYLDIQGQHYYKIKYQKAKIKTPPLPASPTRGEELGLTDEIYWFKLTLSSFSKQTASRTRLAPLDKFVFRGAFRFSRTPLASRKV
ncbi:MAG: hypothetical protein A3K06_03130 [Candidatus Doudnabacteria bacterium RIFCSPHIGHO2_01_52_17]|uniref:Uncharacterized protein n=1 Tax=Candidatus Doudnabacteria bacterium RIFCSPHIGHO2_01_52_17 TaxID=1817820 RepID=A0A1F5NC62_9BACT|nr:MAG: hypothetical protein A3K06_03130 [Candidatus Doudnabacteria bacterium RIFCSPHIGHO2_01_52_17]